MKKSKIENIVIHMGEGNPDKYAEAVSSFLADVIERRMNEAGLTAEQKRAAIDKILENLQKEPEASQ